MSELNAVEVLRFQNRRHITNLFKRFLFIVSRIADEHDIALDKLVDALPEQYKTYVDLADHLSDEDRELVRKEILDTGNDTIRQMDAELEKYEIEFK